MIRLESVNVISLLSASIEDVLILGAVTKLFKVDDPVTTKLPLLVNPVVVVEPCTVKPPPIVALLVTDNVVLKLSSTADNLPIFFNSFSSKDITPAELRLPAATALSYIRELLLSVLKWIFLKPEPIVVPAPSC